ncbi:MAG: sigma-70 family RNA polymerase sigma factor [Nakamurella sp.]
MTFEEFLRVELDGLGKYARLLCGDRQDAHDLAAETLIVAARRWSTISRLEHPTAYVRRMIANRRIDVARRRRILKWTAMPDDAQLPSASDGTRPLSQRLFLDDLLRPLPARQRTAIVLRFYLDLSDEDIAWEMDVAVGTVRSFISRGLAVLRTATTAQDVRSYLQ